MNIIRQGFEFVSVSVPYDGTDSSLQKSSIQDAIKLIEIAGRTCYKSEDKITVDSAIKFVKMLIDRGHHAMIEHAYIGIKMTTDRGVTHEIVRHRLASYGQESTRYCNYGDKKFGNEITVIMPVWFYGVPALEDKPTGDLTKEEVTRLNQLRAWKRSMLEAETAYLQMLALGSTPQEARAVLPNSLKTEIVMTCNVREWLHFFNLRADRAAHPQMKALAEEILIEFAKKLPVIFADMKTKKGI